MRAAVYLEKNQPLEVQTVADPTAAAGQVILAVKGAGTAAITGSIGVQP